MIKIIGAVILLAAAFGYGYLKIREERRKIAETDALCDLVSFIRQNIAHYMKPLPDIFAAYSDRCGLLEENGFIEICRTNGIRAAWEETVFHLPDNVREAMADFVRSIGGGYREDELHLCDYTLEQFEKAGLKMREEIKGKEKLYRTIPPLLALSVMLIFM